MDNTTFEHLEALTKRVTTFLMNLFHTTTDLAVRQAIIAEVNELNELLDKARHELKGGA